MFLSFSFIFSLVFIEVHIKPSAVDSNQEQCEHEQYDVKRLNKQTSALESVGYLEIVLMQR